MSEAVLAEIDCNSVPPLFKKSLHHLRYIDSQQQMHTTKRDT
jgi:hypothetical protein